MFVLAMLVVGATTAIASVDDTYEQVAASAAPLAHVDDLVWATSTPCDKGDDVLQRQCKKLRDRRLAQLATKPLIVDVGELVVGPWSSAKKSAELVISGCLACTGANGTHVIAGAPSVDGPRLAPKPIVTRALPFETEAARTAFATAAKGSRTQLVVTTPAKFELYGLRGVRLDVVAYRVITPCDGKVLLASPTATAIAADPKSCAK